LAAGKTYGAAKKANLIAVKCMDSNGSGSWGNVLAAINFVAQQMALHPGRKGKCVANMSLSASGNGLNTAVRNAILTGCEFVVSAGEQRHVSERVHLGFIYTHTRTV